MDDLIVRELSKLDPTVPFRASTTHGHHTWARTFHSRPELYIRPQSVTEIEKVITLARRCRRRVVTVGCGHSPSDLTCTSSWMMNLDQFNRILSVDREHMIVVMEAGIRLHDLGLELKTHRLAMPNLGSIDNQAIAGAIGTATHGSSTQHGLLSQSVLGLKIMLANGRTVSCSAKQNKELFRAALVSLGALGIITEITYQAVPAFDIEWHQSLHSLDEIIDEWSKGLWTTAEFTRVWWMPYMKKAIVWRADKTLKPRRPPKQTWYGGLIGYHAYHILLYIAQWIPSLLPSIEKFVIGVQYGFTSGTVNTAVEEGHTGLLMNCLYSQFVNEWALPLSNGPEAISRLSAWLNGETQSSSGIPFDNKNLYVHAPIEVRVSDTSTTIPRPYLDNTMPDGPTLYLNATLYRPYNRDPPCRERYYEAFEWLMGDLGGRPHWAKNFQNVSSVEFWD
ncbi:MAG: D-arabinono-1,4-lactone oxidase, partial [Pleopsidium flavum]